MISEDTFDILKYGHVPIKNLIEFAKTKKFNFSNFQYDEDERYYRYKSMISLLYDGDFYDIDCTIMPPHVDSDGEIIQYVSIFFYCGLACDPNNNLPYFPTYHQELHLINSREKIVDVLDLEWKIFVQTAMGMILYHQQEIIDNLDNIILLDVKCNRNAPKKHYIDVMSTISKFIGNNIKNIIEFRKVNDWCVQ